MEQMIVRSATHSDVRAIVDVHMAGFAGFFLTSLGPRFLASYYAGILDCPDGLLLVGSVRDEVAGFAAGAIDNAALHRWLIRHRGVRMARAAVPALRRPADVVRIVEGFGRGTRQHDTPDAWLISFCVDPTHQGGGIGGSLLSHFERALAAAGSSAYALTTDASMNGTVNDFYAKRGLRLDHVLRTTRGRLMNVYVKPRLEGSISPLERTGRPDGSRA